MTQAGLAKASQLSASAIAMYETDRRVPDSVSLAKLASALQISETILLEKSHQPGLRDKEMPTKDTASKTQRVQGESGALPGVTQLALSREEARVILFLRMNPESMTFFQSYITASDQRRQQLDKTWRIINAFQN